MAASPVFPFSPLLIQKVECVNLNELQLKMAYLIDLKGFWAPLATITKLKQSACSDWLIRHLLFAHGCMLLMYSLTKAKPALCDVAQFIEDFLGCASPVHNILTTVMTHIVVNKSTDHAKPH